jgi:hypothetical protein
MRRKVLSLLLSLSALRGESNVEHTVLDSGSRGSIKPAISTFSDHIVISYPLQTISSVTGFEEQFTALTIMSDFSRRLAAIAAAALSIGFLVRGGATVGKLFHAQGVVFGEAPVEAFQIESQVSVYPRVVLSPHIVYGRPFSTEKQATIAKDSDGMYHVDYCSQMLITRLQVGDHKKWLDLAISIVAANLMAFERNGRLKELSKWWWFAHHFRTGLEATNPELLKALDISLDVIPWS